MVFSFWITIAFVKILQVPFEHRVLSGKAFRVYKVIHVTDCIADLFKPHECQ